MNIQCQQCGTSYAVADDKVRGRLMKVRCKSCGEPIRVDGTVLSAESEAPVVASRPGVEGAVWHIAVGDGTQGPYTLDELREYYAQGAVMLDTLVFRDGFEEWQPAGEVPELRMSVPANSQTGAQAFAGAVSMGSDPFGERRAAASSPRVSAAQVMEGQSEHTVQFSLDQIRALSSASAPTNAGPSMVAPRMSTSAGGYAASASSGYASSSAGSYAAGGGYAPSSSSSGSGYASGDGSGLIDVRKLAELHKAMTAERPQEESEPLIPASGSYAHTLAPLSLPLPAAAANQGIDSRTKIVAGLAALGMVLAAAVGVLALTRQPAPAPIASIEGAPQVLAGAQPPSEAAPAAEDEEAEPAAEEPVAAKGDEPAQEAAEEDKEEERASSRSGKRGSKRESRSNKREAADDEPVAKKDKESKASKDSKDSDIDALLADAPSKKKPQSSASASIDDLLDSAVSGKKAAPKAEEKAPSSDLPKTPSREQMLASLGKAKAKAAKCKGSGVATAQIQIAGKTGKATKVDVSGAEGGAKACVEQAVRSTSFPKFQNDSMDVKFPFKLGG
jgi:predicted Zn finger-like uncharacterized protein